MRLLCASVALFLVVLLPAPGAVQTSQLLARAAKASGEPWRHHIRSQIVEAHDGRIVHTQIDEQGTRVLTTRCMGIVCGGTIVDTQTRRRAFFTYNGTPILQTEDATPEIVTVRAIASYAFTSPEFTAHGGRVVEKAEAHVRDRLVVPVSVTAPDGESLDALLDPKTALLAGIARGSRVLFEYEDQRPVGSLILPMRVVWSDGSLERFEDRSVVTDPLTLPTGPPVTFVDSAPDARLEGGDIPRFPCRVEGVNVRCVLDSGASGLAMSLTLADRLHKPLLGQIALQGEGQLTSGVVRADSLDLGSLRVGSALFAVLPDVGGFDADVIVGADVIGLATVRIDPDRRTIRFDRPGSALEGTLVDLNFDGFTPTLPIELASVPSQLALDTGDASSIDLSTRFAEAHPGLFVAAVRRAVVGVGGRGTQATGTIADVEFAGFRLHGVAAGTTDVPGSPAPSRIGAAFLARFRVALDYAGARMSVRPVR